MVETFYRVAGEVMGFFDSFKGSSPAIDNDKILIVRGRSRKVVPLDQLESKLEEVGKLIYGKELDEKKDSDKISDILTRGDKHIHETAEGISTVDANGFSRIKEELESMGLVVAYKVFELPDCDAVVAIWEDKHEIPPLYVEVTVSSKED